MRVFVVSGGVRGFCKLLLLLRVLFVCRVACAVILKYDYYNEKFAVRVVCAVIFKLLLRLRVVFLSGGVRGFLNYYYSYV